MSTNLWEISGLVLSVVQMGFYLNAVDKYKDKLEDFASWLSDSADANREKYKTFRESDPEFYEYYQNLALYDACESAIKRSKGEPFFKFGQSLRRGMSSTRGYTPAVRVHLSNMLSSGAVAESAVSRAITHIEEYQRVDNHVIERWSAIIDAPIGLERYQASASNAIINQSFNTLHAFGQGFNSAGAAFGTTLYRVLT